MKIYVSYIEALKIVQDFFNRNLDGPNPMSKEVIIVPNEGNNGWPDPDAFVRAVDALPLRSFDAAILKQIQDLIPGMTKQDACTVWNDWSTIKRWIQTNRKLPLRPMITFHME